MAVQAVAITRKRGARVTSNNRMSREFDDRRAEREKGDDPPDCPADRGCDQTTFSS
jgi:hypothetical protein